MDNCLHSARIVGCCNSKMVTTVSSGLQKVPEISLERECLFSFPRAHVLQWASWVCTSCFLVQTGEPPYWTWSPTQRTISGGERSTGPTPLLSWSFPLPHPSHSRTPPSTLFYPGTPLGAPTMSPLSNETQCDSPYYWVPQICLMVHLWHAMPVQKFTVGTQGG